MGERRPTARRAVRLALAYAAAHAHVRAVQRATPVASLIKTCDAIRFNPEACRVPVAIPFRDTLPAGQPQYALGRVETLLRAGYYNAGSCIRALNLEYEGPGLRWDIALNDLFVACTAARKHPFGTFPARLVLDVAAVHPTARARAAAVGHVARNNVVAGHRVRVPLDLAAVRPGSVTARELCQLARVFGMKLYAPRRQTGPYRVAFFSHARAVPRARAADWEPFELL